MAIKFLSGLDLEVTSSVLKTDANGVIIAAVAGTDYAAASHTHSYLPLAGGTLTGNVRLNDSVQLQIGSSNDAYITHNGTNTYFVNGVGNLEITNDTTDGDIIFKSDNGSGGLTTYFFLDGGSVATQFNQRALFIDNIAAEFGSSRDLKIYHDGSNSYVENDTGDLYIRSNFQDRDIVLQSDNGSGGTATYIQIDGSTGAVDLNHYGTKKLETTSAGVSVTGDADISGETTFKPKHYAATADVNSDSRSIFSSHATNGTTSNRPINYSSIYTLGGSASNALQISTNEDYSESGMWIRQYNQNSASPQGTGWQNWAEVWTTNKLTATNKSNYDTAYTYSQVGHLPLAGGTIDGSLIIDTNTGSQPLYITRLGNTNESLKIYVGDDAAVFESIQDETASGYGSFIFNMDAGVTEPYFDVRKNNGVLFRVDGSGDVGIGVTAPNESLHVHKDATPRIILTDGTTGTTSGSDGMFLGIASDQGFNIWNYENTYTRFAVNNSEAMRITSAGNVGIGQDTPASSLDVYRATGDASIRIQAETTSDSSILKFRNSNADAAITVDRTTSNKARMVFTTDNTGGYVPVLSLEDNKDTLMYGNAGIGTAAPNHKLDVYSNENVPLRIHRPSNANLNSSGAWGIGFSTRGDANTSTSDTRAGIFSYYNGNLFFATNTSSVVADPDASARMTILNNGDVGIGTSSPNYTLDVEGEVRILNTAGSDPFTVQTPYDRVGKFISTDAGAFLAIQDNSSTNNGVGINVSGDVLKLLTANTVGITLDASQNATFAGGVTVAGDLTVNGTTTTINTATVEVEDNILQLNTTQGSPDTATAATSGISIYRGNGVTQASLIFDDAADTWDLTNRLIVAGTIVASNFSGTHSGSSSGTNTGDQTLPTDFVSAASGGTFGGDITLDDNSGSSPSIYLKNGNDNFWRLFCGSSEDLTFRLGTVTKFDIDSSGNGTFAGIINTSDGSATTPSYNFTSHDGNGMYLEEYDASNNKEQVSIATDGVRRFRANEAGIWSDQNVYFSGSLRKFGEWQATTATTGQGFKFTNTADSRDVLTITAAGNATFAGTVAGSNLSGTNTGDQTLPTASSLGAVTLTGTQTIAGTKTFTGVTTLAAPAAPTSLVTSVVNDTINVTFTASTTSGISNYLVFSSVAGGDYGLISVIPPADFAATMSVIDNSFDTPGTQAYRVYAVKNGVYSSPLTGSRAFSAGTVEVTSMSAVNLNKAFYVQWDSPSSNARFVTAYNVYKHEHATAASLAEGSATLVYSGMNTNFMYSVSGADNNNFHKFWITTTIAS